MSIRAPVGIVVALAVFAGGSPQSLWDAPSSNGSSLFSAAQAQGGFLRNLLFRLRGETLPSGIVRTNGRIEATQVDVAAKYAGRLAEVSVEEGTPVTKGQVVARISSPEYEAQLRAAQADLERANQSLQQAETDIKSRQSALDFAKSEFDRGAEIYKKGAITKRDFEMRQRNFETADAAYKGSTSQRDQAQSAIKNYQAQVERVQSILHDLDLVAPRDGRVQYQLLRAGEVVAAGAPVLTILDLTDVYMTIFLPGADAGKLDMNSEARVILDAVPQYVIPASVSFVAADAQFTPKSVETKDERKADVSGQAQAGAGCSTEVHFKGEDGPARHGNRTDQ